METKVVTHDTPGGTLKATVSEATSLMGMKRSLLISQSLADIREEQDLKEGVDLPDNIDTMARLWLRRYTFPNCMACLIEAEGFPVDLPFDEFAQMPDRFIARWEEAALSLNPHWRLRSDEEDEEEAKKKEPSKSE
jgi:hypothetical protein